jgi:DNA processing protein
MELYKIASANLIGIGKQRLGILCKNITGLNCLFEMDIERLSTQCNANKGLLIKMERNRALQLAKQQLSFNSKYGIKTLFYQDKEYPEQLKECVDAPVVLYYKGENPLNQPKIVSIVGTRKPSFYGKKIVEQFIEQIKDQNMLVVSGLAYGIDTYVHEYCIKHNVATLGVLGHGHHMIYPKSNSSLAKKMCKSGGLLSEFGIHTELSKYNFPKRNRIIAGIAHATIIIESPIKGGSMITANLANSYNREVMAFPGQVSSIRSQGCNELIKNHKAHLISDAEDLFKLMNWSKKANNYKRQVELNTHEALIVQLLQSDNDIHFDHLVQKTEFSTPYLQTIMLSLELKKILFEIPGLRFKLNNEFL